MFKKIFALVTFTALSSVSIANTGNMVGLDIQLRVSEGGGTVLVFDEPSFSSDHCQAINGSEAKIIEQADGEMMSTWVKVDVVTGNCGGESGWVTTESIALS